MSINIITQFKTKPGRSADLIALISEWLPESLEQPGCEEVAIRQNQDDPDDIISAQKWASRQHYERYVAWRTEQGVTAKFNELLVGGIQVRYFNDIPIPPAIRKGAARKLQILQREVPKISTSDAPGG